MRVAYCRQFLLYIVSGSTTCCDVVVVVIVVEREGYGHIVGLVRQELADETHVQRMARADSVVVAQNRAPRQHQVAHRVEELVACPLVRAAQSAGIERGREGCG